MSGGEATRGRGKPVTAELGSADTQFSPESAEPSAQRAQAEAGTRFGRYVIEDKIGAGGMGVVYRAYDPMLERRVALKIVRSVRGGIEVQRRLFREAQLLAQVRHPHIVTVYDVGLLDDDVFVTMELVDGTPMERWQKSRSWREILEAYIAAGHGLAAAHQCGLIHRDIKPGNILVDDRGNVTVIDFGLAMVEGDEREMEPAPSSESESESESESDIDIDSVTTPAPSITEKLTQAGTLVGTPKYMSPEQHLASGSVDARSDQYSFAVAIYEAICGTYPFTGGEAISSQYELLERKRRGKLQPPKQKVPDRLVRALGRALSTLPEDRWNSMDELLRQLESRRMSGQRTMLAAAAVCVAAAGLMVAGGGTDPSERCRGGAQRVQQVWSSDVSAALAQAFAGTNASYASDTAARVASELDERANRWASTHREVCEATWVRGEQSEALLDKRMHCLERRLGAMRSLATLLSTDVDRDLVNRAVNAVVSLEPSATCLRRTLSEQQDQRMLAPEKRARLDALLPRIDELEALRAAGRYAAGIREAEELAATADALAFAPAQAEVLLALGSMLSAAGEFERAAATLARGIGVATRAGDLERAAIMAAKRIDVIGYRLDQHEIALALEPGADMAVVRAGDASVLRAELLSATGLVHMARGDYQSAHDHLRRCLELREQEWDEGDIRLQPALNNVGLVLSHLRDFDDAIHYLQRARALGEAVLGPDHPSLGFSLHNLGNIYAEIGRYDEALTVQRRALALWENAHGPDHPHVATTLLSIGHLLQLQGDYDQAEQAYLRGLAIHEKKHGVRHQRAGIARHRLGALYIEERRFSEALLNLRRSVEIYETMLGPEHPYLGLALTDLGRALTESGAADSALPLLERSWSIAEKGRVADEMAGASFALAKALWETGRDRPRALELAQAARAHADSDSREERRNEISSWLRDHPH